MKKFIVFLIVLYVAVCGLSVAAASALKYQPDSKKTETKVSVQQVAEKPAAEPAREPAGRAGLSGEDNTDEDDLTETLASDATGEDTSESATYIPAEEAAETDQASEEPASEPSDAEEPEVEIAETAEEPAEDTADAEEPADITIEAESSEEPDYSSGMYTFMTIHESGTLRVRKTPDSDGKGIAYLYPGAVGLVLGREGDFTCIQYKEKVGYVPNEYVALFKREE